MPLLRNISGLPRFGLIAESSATDMMRNLPGEGGGGAGDYSGELYPRGVTETVPKAGDEKAVFPVTADPVYYNPLPQLPVEPVQPIERVYTAATGDNEQPVPNEVALPEMSGGKVDWVGVLITGSVLLAATGLHPLRKVGSGVLLGVTSALLYVRMSTK